MTNTRRSRARAGQLEAFVLAPRRGEAGHLLAHSAAEARRRGQRVLEDVQRRRREPPRRPRVQLWAFTPRVNHFALPCFFRTEK